jgi:hypothetical protein
LKNEKRHDVYLQNPFYESTTSEKPLERLERKVTNRIDNLADTLAYKHEVKAMEDAVHLLKIRVDASDYIQKENEKKHYDLEGNIK